MNRTRFVRLFSVASAAALMAAALAFSPVAAKTPSGWSATAVLLPDTVKPGNEAGYEVTIRNVGPSNINAVTFSAVPKDTPNATPTYFSGLPGYACTETGQLSCDLGTLVVGTELKLTVAYRVPPTSTSGFLVAFKLRAGTGYVEGNNQSRGDAYENPYTTATDTSDDFDGGFVRPTGGDVSYATIGTLGRGNKQTSEVVVTGTAVTVNIRDRITDDLCHAGDYPKCANQFGEWTRLNVPGSTGYLKVTLNIYGGSVPGGATTNNIFLIHVLDDGTVQIIGDDPGERCADASVAPTSGECIAVTKVGSNFKIVAWLTKNGGLRGGY